MKIIFFARSFYPNIGGVEKHVLEISKILVARGNKIIVITEKNSLSNSSIYHSSFISDKFEGIEIIRINAGKEGMLKKFRVWLALVKYFKKISSADIIHCHDIFFWYLPFRFIFPFKKVFTTFHGYEGNNLPTKKSIIMHKLSEKFSMGNICVGDFLKKWYGTKPNFVTYGAVDIKSIENLKSSKVNYSKIKIAFIGRLEEETGIMKYLEALKILKDKNLSLELDVYGDGKLEKEVEAYSKKNKLRVQLKGFIPNIESVLNNYEYIFCSRYLGILESMAFSKPVFAEYNNLIKKDYLLMSPFSSLISVSQDAEEIALSVSAEIVGKQKIDVIKGYDWVKNKTWENMTNLYLKLWNSTM